ncbi:MAG: hypothetical protein SPI15_09380 [Candidatus Faecousia sp.]|nr:alpha/beta hydrolase fold domain-containing protein [Clostridiales bacterium]MDY6181047.1 hypothetical protein [Candidatus Faecousia sp.]
MRFGQTIRAEVPDIPEALRCKTVPKLFLQPVPENCIEHGIRYLRAHAGEFGIDPERIGIYGGSLGGNTALMIALTGDNPALEGSVGGNTGYSSRVQAAALHGATC